MCSCRFAWQAWHFVTFHVCEVQDCREAEVAVPIGKVAKTCLFRRVTRCAHVVFAWQAWHFVTFHVCEAQDCRESEVTVPMGKVTQTFLFRRVTRCAHVVLRGKRGTL